MTKVGARELKNRFGKYLARVKAGETILVTDRGKTVAMVVPPPPANSPQKTIDQVLQELAAAGHLRLPTRPLSDFKPIKAKGKPASRIIIEERR